MKTAMEPNGDVFPSSGIAADWIKRFSAHELLYTDVKNYWQDRVPNAYRSLKYKCVSGVTDLEGFASALIYELKEFIYYGVDKSDANFSDIVRCRPQCGKMLKQGEPSYGCRECGTNETCVLCVDCFTHSNHKYHKYKMGVSSGAGVCDCGDSEAWKCFPNCDLHPLYADELDNQRIKFPPDLYERSKCMYYFVLQFALETLNKRSIDDKYNQVDYSRSDGFLLVMYNNDTHTFDQVIACLKQVLNCSDNEGRNYASKINKKGRAVLMESDFHSCTETKCKIESLASLDGNVSLEMHIIPFRLMACQHFAMSILSWIQEVVKLGTGFRLALTEVLLSTDLNNDTLLDHILTLDSVLWRSARVEWHLVLYSCMLFEYSSKKRLAIHFVKNYRQIMHNYVTDQEHRSFSTANLSVQLFTVPSIAHDMISSHDALKIVIDFIVEQYSACHNCFDVKDFRLSSLYRSFLRSSYSLFDARYLLGSPPEHFTDDLRTGFITGVSSLLNLLSLIETANGVTRQLETHVEYETGWMIQSSFFGKLVPAIDWIYQWCSTDKLILLRVYEMVLIKLKNHECSYSTIEIMPTKQFGNDRTELIHFDPTQNPVSIYFLLTRLWSGLFLLQENHPINREEFVSYVKQDPSYLIEPSLRNQAMLSQFRAGMWKLNGRSLANQVMLYHSSEYRAQMLDKDIEVLQIGASIIQSNDFVLNVLYKFGLLKWGCIGFITAIPHQLRVLLEEFLNLIIILTSERFNLRLGNVSSNDCLKYEIIHLLSIKPISHSELMNKLSLTAQRNQSTENILAEVTIADNCTTEKRNYELKKQYYNDFNMFYYHFSKEDSFKAEQSQKAIHKKLNGLECCPPPILPTFRGSFINIINLLKCKLMLRIMQWILNLSIALPDHFNDHLHKVLFLIGTALREEELNQAQFKFTTSAKEFDIYILLVKLYNSRKSKEYTDLLKWTINKYRVLSKDEVTDTDIYNDHVPSENQTKNFALAEKARAEIMAKMKSMQQQFANHNPESETLLNVPNVATETAKSGTCILCQEVEFIITGGRTLIAAAFVQLSTVQVMDRKNHLHNLEYNPSKLILNMGASPYISTCGHVMHADCWEKWRLVSLESGLGSRRTTAHYVGQHEYLCPFCQRISNTILPIIGQKQSNAQEITLTQQGYSNISFAEWQRIILSILHIHANSQQQPASKNQNKQYANSSLLEDYKIVSEEHSNESGNKVVITESNCSRYIFESSEQFVFSVKHCIDDNDFKHLSNNLLDSNQITYMNSVFMSIHDVTNGQNQPQSTKWATALFWKTAAYTIRNIECCLRYLGKPLLGAFSVREEMCLESLINLSTLIGESGYNNSASSSQALNTLSIVFGNDISKSSIVHWDCFGIFVMLLGAMPSIIHKGDLHDVVSSVNTFLTRLILTCHICQILVVEDFQNAYASNTNDAVCTDTECLTFIMKLIDIHHCFNTKLIWEKIKDTVRPFLRCCTIFHFFYSSDGHTGGLDEFGNDTFENLCKFLGLPISCRELIGNEMSQALFVTWLNHPKIKSSIKNIRNVTPINQLTTISQLIDLPDDYTVLLNGVLEYTCPNSDMDNLRNPTMCLVCGEVMCSLSYCCLTDTNNGKVGGCTSHALKCGGGSGIFLQIQECQLILLAGYGRGCRKTPPYLDEYGEPDEGLLRGNPLRLCHNIYHKLKLLWMNHNIYAEVLDSIESENFNSTPWHLV